MVLSTLELAIPGCVRCCFAFSGWWLLPTTVLVDTGLLGNVFGTKPGDVEGWGLDVSATVSVVSVAGLANGVVNKSSSLWLVLCFPENEVIQILVYTLLYLNKNFQIRQEKKETKVKINKSELFLFVLVIFCHEHICLKSNLNIYDWYVGKIGCVVSVDELCNFYDLYTLYRPFY